MLLVLFATEKEELIKGRCPLFWFGLSGFVSVIGFGLERVLFGLSE